MLDYIYGNIIIYGLCVLLFSTLLSMYLVPFFHKLSKDMDLTDAPSARKSHSFQVPILGGVAVVLSAGIPIILISIFFQDLLVSTTASIIGAGSIILLVLGVIDDIGGLKPFTKLILKI